MNHLNEVSIMLHPTNIKFNKYCAFCKYWYDPTNQHIQPSDSLHNIWKYETDAKCMCLKKNYPMGAGFNCSKYECKI